jgi:hypothetical protein
MGDNTGNGWSPLVIKLLQFTLLSDNDVSVLEALCSREKRLGGSVDTLAEADAPRSAFVLRDGMACRYRILADGR